MTVNELIEKTELKPIVLSDGELEISGVYCGDLLSWVMGKAESGNLWVTIMSNVNVLAVATLEEISAVILSENVALEQSVLDTARQKNVNILSSPLGTYETAVMLGSVL